MFGTNEIVGKKFFKNAPKNSLFITSMFLTLQGEGPYGGMVAFFIRTTKCNLACSFCDTFFDAGDWMTFEEIEAKIKALKKATKKPIFAMSGVSRQGVQEVLYALVKFI